MSSHIQYPVAVSMGKAEYPDHSEIVESIRKFTDKILEIDAQKIAIEAGSSRALNMVMFGGIIGIDIYQSLKKLHSKQSVKLSPRNSKRSIQLLLKMDWSM